VVLRALVPLHFDHLLQDIDADLQAVLLRVVLEDELPEVADEAGGDPGRALAQARGVERAGEVEADALLAKELLERGLEVLARDPVADAGRQLLEDRLLGAAGQAHHADHEVLVQAAARLD